MLEFHSVNTSGSAVWTCLKGHFGLNPLQMKREVHGLFEELTTNLSNKGIQYSDLKPALVPSHKRQQVALFFDTSQISDGWYGRVVHRKVLAQLTKKSTQSVLSGDLIGHSLGQNRIRAELDRSLIKGNPYRYQHSSLLYVVFVNNASVAGVAQLHSSLLSLPAYIGHIELCCDSLLRRMLSVSLVPGYLLHRGVGIVAHEDGMDHSEDHNEKSYPFDEFGFGFRSIEGIAYDTFLNYRIERPQHPQEESTELELGSVATNATGLHTSNAVVETSKFNYLQSAKAECLKNAGILTLSSEELSDLIASKLRSNYLFNLRYRADSNTVLFNIMIEVPQQNSECRRVLVGLEYREPDDSVRVVTIF